MKTQKEGKKIHRVATIAALKSTGNTNQTVLDIVSKFLYLFIINLQKNRLFYLSKILRLERRVAT